MMSLLFCCHGAESEMYSRKVLRSGFAYFLVSLASCTAGISIHPDVPRQTLMLSQHGCRQASFSLPLQGQFIPNLLSMWQVQLCYWFGQSVLMCSGMRNAYCLPPLVCVSIKMLPGKCSEILDSSPPLLPFPFQLKYISPSAGQNRSHRVQSETRCE